MPSKRPPNFNTAIIVSHGPSDKAYVKAMAEDNHEIYLYPDDSGTVDLRLIPIGRPVNIRNLSFVDTAGPTLYKANAQHIDLQSNEVKDLCFRKGKNKAFVVKSKKTPRQPFHVPSKISVAHSDYRYEAISALAEQKYGNTTTSISRMTGDMVDFYLCSKHEEVQRALKLKEEWKESVDSTLSA